MKNYSEIAALLGITTAIITIILFLWKVFQTVGLLELKLQNQINSAFNQLEKKDVQLENLALSHELLVNGLKERAEHSISRLRETVDANGKRLTDLERWSQKSGYEPRNY